MKLHLILYRNYCIIITLNCFVLAKKKNKYKSSVLLQVSKQQWLEITGLWEIVSSFWSFPSAFNRDNILTTPVYLNTWSCCKWFHNSKGIKEGFCRSQTSESLDVYGTYRPSYGNEFSMGVTRHEVFHIHWGQKLIL